MNATANRHPRRLRPEARPFALTALKEPQRQALREIAAWLALAVDSARARHSGGGQASRLPDFDFLDAKRHSQVFFLSGCRGSGKTSVMLSLMEAMNARTLDAGSTDELYAPLHALRQSTIWLEPLDLETLPAPTNLLAAILARVERAVGLRRGQATGHGQEFNDDDPRVMLELQRLQNDVARAWDGNLGKRAGSLDPESYAIEAVDIERARLALNQRLAGVLKQVGDEIVRSAGGPSRVLAQDSRPVFVLFVDDFDLNPTQAVYLLRLLRMVSVGQLFTILSGDIEMAERMNYLMVSGTFAELRQGRRGMEDELAQYASDIAANALRKLVPPSQRYTLEPLSVDAALAFKPSPEDATLLELLQGIALPSPHSLGGTTLADFFQPRSLLGQHDEKLRYRGASIFHAPVRHVLDLWLQLSALIAELPADQAPTPRRLVEFAADMLTACIREEPRLDAIARARFLDAFGEDAMRQEWELDGAAFDLRTMLAPGPMLRPRLGEEQVDGILPELTFNIVRGWALRPWRDDGATRPAFEPNPMDDADAPRAHAARPLGDRTLGALATFHDLLRITGTGVIAPRLRDEHLQDRAYCTWPIAGRPLRVTWFNTVWETMLDFEAFAEVWNCGLQAVIHTREQTGKLDEWQLIEAMAFSWIAGGVALLTRRAIRPTQLEDAPLALCNLKGHLDWPKLSEGVLKVVADWEQAHREHRFDLSHRQGQAWLINLACLLAPETGVPTTIWESLGAAEPSAEIAKRLRAAWREDGMARAIRNRRAERLGRGLLTPLGLALVAPDVARSLGQSVADKLAKHPLNNVLWETGKEAGGRCLCPGSKTILRTLSQAAPLRLGESERRLLEELNKQVGRVAGATASDRPTRTQKARARGGARSKR